MKRSSNETGVQLYRKWGTNPASAKWNTRLKNACKVSPNIDGSGDVDTLEKIFDINQQLKGKLGKY